MAELKRFRVQYGQGGHEWEYCVNIEGHSLEANEYIPIPEFYIKQLVEAARLSPEVVMNRGTRIEVFIEETPEATAAIVGALEGVGLTHDPTGWWF